MATQHIPPGAGPANPTMLPAPDTAAAIWADACRDKAAIARDPRRFIRLAKMLSAFERNDVELAVEMLIEAFDRIDGDPDVEPNGDEADTGVIRFGSPDPLYRLPEHRDAAIYLAGLEDDEDADEREEDDHGGGNIEDVGEMAACRERINQTAMGDFQHEDAEEDDPDHDPLDIGELDEADAGDTPIYGVNQTMPPMSELRATDTMFAANAS